MGILLYVSMACDFVGGAVVTLTNEQETRARAAAFASTLPYLQAIMQDVCKVMGADLDEVRAHGKSNPLAIAARVQIAKCAREVGFSYPQIGRAMNRDPSTVRCAVNQE